MKIVAILCLVSSSLVSNVISFQATTKLSIPRNARSAAPLLVPALSRSKVKRSWLELNALRTSDQSLKKFQSNSTVTVPFPKEEYVEPSQQNPTRIDIDNDTVQADTKIIYIMMALIFSVASLCSLDRVAMSVALVPMSEEMGLTDSIKGSISSLYSVGYGLGILPAGLLLAYASPRVVMAAGIALWSIGTLATPFAAGQIGMAFLLGARGLVGASESVVFPSIQRILSNWVPKEKKGLAMAWVFSGFQSGTILAYSLSPLVIDQFGSWRDLFYVYGGAGLVFLIPWLALAKDAPAVPEEEAFEIPKIMKQTAVMEELSPSISPLQQGKDMITAAPWKEFAQSKGVWGMFFAHAANNWGLYNNLSWTPTFYAEQYGLNVKESAILLIIPSIAGMIGGLSAGTIADSVIQNMDVKTDEAVTNVRKTFQGIGLVGPGICLATLALHVPEQAWVTQSLLTAAVGMQAFNAAGYGSANQEKAGEKWTGLLYSITSLPSVWFGTFGVYFTGRVLDYTNQDWSYVFGLNSIIYVLGGAAFVALYDSKKEFD